jgi:hypothetical protein
MGAYEVSRKDGVRLVFFVAKNYFIGSVMGEE